MAAQNTDLLMEVSISSATTLDSPGYTIGDTSITVVSVSTWPTATGITFAMDEVDAAGVQVAGTYNEYVGVKASATSITNVSHQNGTNQNYTAGATTRVYIPVSAERENRIVEWGLTEHEQDGTHAVELITSRTEDTNPDPDADFLLTYDTSASALKKVKPSNLSGGLTGWTPNVLPSVSSVTNNGNRSYDVTFGSTVASYLTPGMRVRTSRTVAAPTQCTDLESGSSQYFSKSSPTNMAQTDDITEMAWIKLESYTGSEMTISSRANGTTDGWRFAIDASGRVLLAGMRAADDYVRSYQSVPLGKWVHVAASIDSSGGTGATYIDGIAVPTEYGNNGNTAFLTPTADFRIGAGTGGTLFFDGKIAQVAHFSAVISAATLRSYMSQGLSGSETSLISAYSFNNSINDLNANANNLTAQGSAVATNADSPFTVDANGVVGGTYDFGIVTKVATTTATVQVPEGCAIPTSGGVSAVDLSTSDSPFGFPNTKLVSAVLVASSYSTTSTSAVQIPGLTTTVTVPTNATNIKITALLPNVTANGITDTYVSIWDGTVGSGTQLTETHQVIPANGYGSLHTATAVTKPTANSKTYGVGLRVNANTGTFSPGGITTAGLLLVEYL